MDVRIFSTTNLGLDRAKHTPGGSLLRLDTLKVDVWIKRATASDAFNRSVSYSVIDKLS